MSYNPPQKNVEYIFYIGLISQATGQLQANPTIAAGDFKASTDGGALGNLSTLPAVTPAGSKAVKITLSTTEMNGDNVVVIGSDAAGAEWDDVIITIQPSVSFNTDGTVKADLTKILGTALTETAGQIAAAFKQFFNIASPTSTMNAITGVTTVTNLTNAPTSGDLTATMKTSVTTAATAATPTVTISTGSGAGQLDITSGVVKANLAQILGTALTETAGQIAAAFKKFFDKATPTGTINSLPDAVAGAAGGVAIVGSVMGKSPATLAAADVSGNLPVDVKAITAGVDLTATMKSSVTTAATAATPTVTISSGTGAGQLSIASGVVASNMTQIDGQATNGNNATLNLKKLNIVNTNDQAVYVETQSADAVKSRVTSGNGCGLRLEGSGTGSGVVIGGALIINGPSGSSTENYALVLSGALAGIFAEGWDTGGRSLKLPNDIAVSDGDLTLANLQLISAGQLTVKKNTALPDFAFVMTDSNNDPATGLTVAAERRIDSGSFAACANTPATELANGWYTIDLDASDLNGTSIALRFSAVGASDTNFTIITQD